MKHQYVKKLAIAGILTAVGVIGGTLSVPVGFTYTTTSSCLICLC